MEFEHVGWIRLAQKVVQWQIIVNTVLQYRVK
jgi:hypothetical protein